MSDLLCLPLVDSQEKSVDIKGQTACYPPLRSESLWNAGRKGANEASNKEARSGGCVMQCEGHDEKISLQSRASHSVVRRHHGTNYVSSSFRGHRSILAIVAFGALTLCDANAAECKELLGKTFGDALVFEVADVQGAMTVATLDDSEGTVLRSPLCRVRGMMTPGGWFEH